MFNVNFGSVEEKDPLKVKQAHIRKHLTPPAKLLGNCKLTMMLLNGTEAEASPTKLQESSVYVQCYLGTFASCR